MPERIIATGYINPDTDTRACISALPNVIEQGNILNSGRPLTAVAAMAGRYQKEVGFVINELGLAVPEQVESLDLTREDNFVLADTNDRDAIHPKIPREAVIYIWDHHDKVEPGFPNATYVIEKVGAAATLIARLYSNQNVPIEDVHARALSAAIYSNTVGLKVESLITSEDMNHLSILTRQAPLRKGFVDDMFKYKSTIEGDETLEQIIKSDLKNFVLSTQEGKSIKLFVAQLEWLDLSGLLKHNGDEIRQLLRAIMDEDTSFQGEKIAIFQGVELKLGKQETSFIGASEREEKILDETWGDIPQKSGVIFSIEGETLLRKQTVREFKKHL